MNLYLYLILGASTIAGVGYSFLTRGVFYHTPSTDNEIMTYSAAQAGKWRWFSDMHLYGMKTYMKDASIILIALLQRVMNDYVSDHPYTALGGLAISISSILIYILGAGFWGPVIGLLISLLYLFSFWPWQTALYGGHANVAGMFFLLAVYFILNSDLNLFLFLLIAGMSICCMIFSSGSASKLLGPIFAALFYIQYREVINLQDFTGLYNLLPFHRIVFWDLGFVGLFMLFLLIISFAYKGIIKKMYSDECPRLLRGIITNQKNLTLQHYIETAGKKIRENAKISVKFLIPPFLLWNIIGLNYLFPVLCGFILVFFILTVPHPIENVRKFFYYAFHNQNKKHFRHYIDYFASRGITIFRHTRGAGLPWVPRLLWAFMPWHFVIFIISFMGLLFTRVVLHQYNFIVFDVSVMLVAILPLLWAELTRATQASRIYVPLFAPSLLFVGYAFYELSGFSFILPIAFLFTVLAAAWNLWKFFYEIYPARMGAVNLVKTLRNLNVRDIYTYKTSYNESLVYTVPGVKDSPYVPRNKIIPPFNVHYIESIADVSDGWIVIPGTNGLAISMDSEPEAINDNFRYSKDKALNKLLDTKYIEKIATSKFKTYGTSPAWASECEVLSYFDLILHDINKDALFRGHAWLLHSSKLKLQN